MRHYFSGFAASRVAFGPEKLCSLVEVDSGYHDLLNEEDGDLYLFVDRVECGKHRWIRGAVGSIHQNNDGDVTDDGIDNYHNENPSSSVVHKEIESGIKDQRLPSHHGWPTYRNERCIQGTGVGDLIEFQEITHPHGHDPPGGNEKRVKVKATAS